MALYLTNFVNHIDHFVNSGRHVSHPENRDANTDRQTAKKFKADHRYRYHDSFGDGATADYWPIPIAYLEDMQQGGYWEVIVSNHNAEALAPPRIWGQRFTNVVKECTRPDHSNIYKTTIFGKDYDRWIGGGGWQRPGSLPPDSSFEPEYAKWEAKQQRSSQEVAVKVALRRQQQEGELLRRDRERVRLWIERRAMNPVPLSRRGKARRAKASNLNRSIQPREEELRKVDEAMLGEYEKLTEDDIEKEKAVSQMLEDVKGILEGDDTSAARLKLIEILSLTHNILHKAEAYILLGSLELTPERKKYVKWAVSTLRKCQILWPDLEADWDQYIKEAENVEKLIRETVKRNSTLNRSEKKERKSISKAYEAQNEGDEAECAKIVYPLVYTSPFESIRAYAHLLIASLEGSNDRQGHVNEALKGFKNLQRYAPAAGHWPKRIRDAEKLLNILPPDSANQHDLTLTEDDEHNLLSQASGRKLQGDEAGASRIYKSLLHSRFRPVKAQANYGLALLAGTGSVLQRFGYAYKALTKFQQLEADDPNNLNWSNYKEAVEALVEHLKLEVGGGQESVAAGRTGDLQSPTPEPENRRRDQVTGAGDNMELASPTSEAGARRGKHNLDAPASDPDDDSPSKKHKRG